MPLAQRLGIPIVRRYSGGGTVYHDWGNTCYSVMMPRAEFDRDRYARLMAKALGGFDLRVGPRHDIFLGEHKVSGSAYRIVRERAYHHGTMLLNSDLSRLGELLKSDLAGDARNAISSVPSPVTNLNLEHDEFIRIVSDAFETEEGRGIRITVCDLESNELRHDLEELSSWEWTFGKTPPFTVDGVSIVNGRLSSGEPFGSNKLALL